MLIRIVFCLLAAIAWVDAARADKTVKVFVLAGQSNMGGEKGTQLFSWSIGDFCG